MRASLRFFVLMVVAAAVPLACSEATAPTWTFPVPAAAPPAAAQTSTAGNPTAPTSATVAAMPGMAGMPGIAAGPTTTAATSSGPTTSPASSSAATAAGSSEGVARLDLTIVTGDMIGHTEYPAYIPSDFTLPSNSTVVVTITNFDDATPLTTGYLQYASVTGTVGDTMNVTPIDPRSPNSATGQPAAMTALNPNDVSHTFTIPQLGINVPIAAHTRTTFTIRTGAAGTYAWRCFDPCGADPMGWGTAMAAKRGFMEGTLTVV